MSYSQTIAEESKNDILDEIDVASVGVEQNLNATFRESAFYLTISILLPILLILLLIIVILVIYDIITLNIGLIIFAILSLLFFILSALFYNSILVRARKTSKTMAFIFTNFISSEEVLTIIDQASLVYLKTAGLA